MSTQPGSSIRGHTHTVIEALYELPLGGSWADVQAALCGFWQAEGEAPSTDQIALLERHFDRTLSFLERLPNHEQRWRNELYRMPVPAAVFSKNGALVDANDAGRSLLAGDQPINGVSEKIAPVIRRAIEQLDERRLAAVVISGSSEMQLRAYISELPSNLHGEQALFLAVIVSNMLPQTARELLMQQFGLTPSEARLCLQLASGCSLDDVARQTEAKKNTLRTHLANTFDKLEVSSQPALVSLVLHCLFTGSQLPLDAKPAPKLTAHLDPELHGYPKFSKLRLTDGRQLGYFEYGDPDGVPAIYLHGTLDSGLFMRSQRLHGNGVRLVAVERGGVGESDPNPDPTPDAYALDLVQLVNHLGLDAYVVMGRSMGSWDAVSLSLHDSSRAKLLVLVSGRLPVEQTADHIAYLPFYRSLYYGIWHSKTMGRLMLRAMQIQLMVRGPEMFMPEDGLPDVEVDLVRDPIYRRHMTATWMRSIAHGPDPTNAHLKLYQEPVINPVWQDLRTPTILMHGDCDVAVPLERIEAQTASFVDREVVVFPGVAHRLINVAMGEVLRRTRVSWASRGF